MSFSINPQSVLGSAVQGITGLPIIIGLPSPQAKVPNFVTGITTTEKARTSASLPGMQLTGGDLFMKGARNSGRYTFQFIIDSNPNVKSEKIQQISQALQQISTLANTFAFFGGVLPNVSGITSGVVGSQIATLNAMKDGFQPILALNMFMPLSSFSTTNPYLSSVWYISDIDYNKGESESGVVVEITLQELLYKRDAQASFVSIATNLANELLGPGVGSAIGGLL